MTETTQTIEKVPFGGWDPTSETGDPFALRLLLYVRDESHRFAQHYHHLLRQKRFTPSKKEPGI